jgi:hypothetical protein
MSNLTLGAMGVKVGRRMRAWGVAIVSGALAAGAIACQDAPQRPPGGGGAIVGANGDVVFSAPSQAFVGELRVEMNTALVGAEIRYTLDRTSPIATSSLFDGAALAITKTTQLRAQAFVAGQPVGGVSVALYIARAFDAESDVPLIIVDGYGLGASTDKDVWLDAAIMIFEPAGGQARLSALPALATHAGYHLHGSSSARLPQKSYRIELRGPDGDDRDHAVLGMPAESDWVLVAPYYDRALVRNPFVYGLGRDMGLLAPRVRHAEVYINYADRPVQASDYAGVYYVTETIKTSQHRVALDGGYIMKFDWAVSEEPRLTCSGSGLANSAGGGHCWDDLEIVEPDPIVDAQRASLTNYVQALHDALHATPMGDYASAVDVPSLVDNFIINELVKNIDEFTRSAYYHKPADGKLVAGPLWDYNFALDSGRPTNRNPEGWQYVQAASEPGHVRVGASDWYVRLAADAAFMAQVSARWSALRHGVLSNGAVDQRISDVIAGLAAAAARDAQRWPVSTVFSTSQAYSGPSAPTWEGQVQAIRDWLPRRLAWMDAQLL